MRAAALATARRGALRRRAHRLRVRLDRNSLALDGLAMEGPGVVRGIELPVDAPDALVARNTHGLYCVPRSSAWRPCAAAILHGQVWESEVLDLMCQTGRDADIVQAGTYYGDFLPALSRSRSGGALVWAFEPAEENFRCTEITAALNRLENVRLTHAGLGTESGVALLATGTPEDRSLGGGSRILRDPSRSSKLQAEHVQLVAVDDVVPPDRRIAVVQLDVEGQEKEALLGAMATIKRCQPLIIVENMPHKEWLAEHLPGYRVLRKIKHRWVSGGRAKTGRNTVLGC